MALFRTGARRASSSLRDFISKHRRRPRDDHDGGHTPVSPNSLKSGRPGFRMLAWGSLVVLSCLVVFNIFMGVSGVRWLEDALLLRTLAVKHVSLDCGAGRNCSRRLLILQTSDGASRYSKMLDATMGVQMAYANLWGHSYLRWDGIARGDSAWLATYNRIYLLHELYRRGKYQWVLFMDPDAVFVDPSQGVEQFLDDSYAVVGCRGGLDRAKIWDINIGVAFFNLQHPDFGGLIREWLWRIKWVPDTRLRKGKSDTYVTGEKGMGFPDDQQMFHEIVKRHPRKKTLVKRYFDIEEEKLLFNYQHGKIIAHLIRANNKNQDARLAELQEITSKFYAKLADVQAEKAASLREGGLGAGEDAEPSLGVAP